MDQSQPVDNCSVKEDFYGNLVDKSPLHLISNLLFISDKLKSQQSEINENNLLMLQALYRVLHEQYGYGYFARYATCDLNVLYQHLASFSHHADPVAQALSDLNRVLWDLHYRDFCEDPYSSVAEWRVDDTHQNRSMRSIFLNINYIELLRLACVMNVSCQEVSRDKEQGMYDAIAAKYEEITSALFRREETCAEFTKAIKFQDFNKQSQSLRAVLVCLEKANRIYS